MLQWHKSKAKEINKSHNFWKREHIKTTVVSKYINVYEENIEKITKMLSELSEFNKFVE